MGPNKKEVVFLVDTGAARSSLAYKKSGLNLTNNTLRVTGVEGFGVAAPLFETTELYWGTKIVTGQLLHVPEAGPDLLGRGLIVKLGLQLKTCEKGITVSMKLLAENDEKEINPMVWVREGNRGGLNITPLKITVQEGREIVRQRQYPISWEGKRGLKPVAQTLVKDGLLEPCMSPCNAPISPVRKPDESRDIFAFEWEDPETGRKQQYRWTGLPQGFTESPSLFGQELEKILEMFQIPEGVTLLQYVDDLVISGAEKSEVREATNKLLNFLGEHGLRVSKDKLQYVEKEVRYLGRPVSEGKRRINPERIQGIVQLPLPKTKKELRKFGGLIGYCRLWTESYAQKTKKLYLKLLEEEPNILNWTKEEKEVMEKLKKRSCYSTSLSSSCLTEIILSFYNRKRGCCFGCVNPRTGR